MDEIHDFIVTGGRVYLELQDVALEDHVLHRSRVLADGLKRQWSWSRLLLLLRLPIRDNLKL